MANAAQWIAGSRPRTLPAAIAPVLVGTTVAAAELPGSAFAGISTTAAALALVVALSLQVAVNYANDYSDGVRGTDADRVGPFRLVGSGAAESRAVLRVALAWFTLAGGAGLALVLITHSWALLGVGAAALLAAWFYTGGPTPYGYRGLGEVSVFVFFGLVAVMGTTYVQLQRVPADAVLGGIGCGALACALLVVNNLRDLTGDAAAGKRTLAVRLGDRRTRWFYVGLLVLAYAAGVVAAGLPEAWLVTAAALLAYPPIRLVRSGATGRQLIDVLSGTGRLQLVYALLLSLALLIE